MYESIFLYEVSFCSYWITLIFNALSLGIIWVLSVQEKEHNNFFRLTLAFSIINLIASITTFLIYYYRIIGDAHGTPLWIMIIAHIAGNSIFLCWIFFLSYILEKKKKFYQFFSVLIAAFVIVSFIVIAPIGMDRHYYIADQDLRTSLILATVIGTICIVVLLIMSCIECRNLILDNRCRTYIYIIALILSVNQIARFFVDSHEYGLVMQFTEKLSYIDPSGFSAMTTSIATTAFAITADFSPLFKQKNRNAVALIGIEKLAVLHNLTMRETEVVNRLCQGLTYIEISENLHISINTVKRHIHNCYKKLDVKSRSELLIIVNRTS